MKLALAGLLIAFSLAAGEINAPVALFSRFEQPLPEAVGEALRSELDNIMQPAGIRLVWRALPTKAGQEVHRELVVVSFKGCCRVHDTGRSYIPVGALGWTHTSGGDLLPFIDVRCDHILRLLQSELRRIRPDERDERLGRALGRVLAHELYHVLGRTRKHGSGGIAKSMYSAREMLAEHFQLEEADIRRMWANRPEFNPEPAEIEAGH